MEHRIVQVSRCVEEVLQETLNVLTATEDEDAQISRQTNQPSRPHMDALLLSHRHANGATEQLQIDLQQAQAAMRRMQAQGWHAGNTATPQLGALDDKTSGMQWPADHAKAMDAYEAEMHACCILKPE